MRRFLASRDEASFRSLYARHAGAVFALAVRISGSREDGEELLQEAWVRAAARLDSFRWESSLKTWLCGIVVNCWRERLRGRGPNVLEVLAEDGSAEPFLLPAAERIDLERALQGLPDGYREVVLLHDVYGYTHEEIADLLGIEPGTSKSQLSRGRGWLRRRLGSRDERGKR